MINLNGSADELALRQQEYRGRGMNGGILIVGFIAIGIVVLFLYALLKIARDNDRAARHAEKELIPFSDVTVTHTGTGGA